MNELTQSTVLVVDDTPENLNVLITYLDKRGLTILVAQNGEKALALVEQFMPHLILLDVMMPGIDGFETCRRLKEHEATREIPVIFMTALSNTVDKVKGFEVGGVDYITKPFQHEEVLARVTTHLMIRRLQNQLQSKNEELQLKNSEIQAKNTMLTDREVHLTHLVEEKTRKIENMTIALVNALENANFYNDGDTGHHIKRVSEYSAFIAEQYGCDREFVKRIKLYASLHDVGKVGLPDTVLKKPGKYTKEEFIAMQAHVVVGARMLESDEIDVMTRNIARYHHEKWNGTGYVHRLAGEAIPFEARIVAIADVYDALISERVYKERFSEDTANRIIREESGKHFEPKIVEIFLQNKRKLMEIRHSLVFSVI